MYIRFSFYLQVMVRSLYLRRCWKQYFPLFLILFNNTFNNTFNNSVFNFERDVISDLIWISGLIYVFHEVSWKKSFLRQQRPFKLPEVVVFFLQTIRLELSWGLYF